MATLYRNFRKADALNIKPGYAANAWVLPISWIDTYADVVGTVDVGNKFTIDESHTLVTNKGFIPVYVVPKTTEGNGELVGEQLAKRWAWRPKIIIPGDDPVKQELIENLSNEDFLLFIKDSECGATQYVQFGCDCDPCQVDTGAFASGTVGEGRKQTELNLLAYCKFFYNGVITELDDEVEEEA